MSLDLTMAFTRNALSSPDHRRQVGHNPVQWHCVGLEPVLGSSQVFDSAAITAHLFFKPSSEHQTIVNPHYDGMFVPQYLVNDLIDCVVGLPQSRKESPGCVRPISENHLEVRGDGRHVDRLPRSTSHPFTAEHLIGRGVNT
jgi:hypothetical protein